MKSRRLPITVSRVHELGIGSEARIVIPSDTCNRVGAQDALDGAYLQTLANGPATGVVVLER